MGTKPMTEEKGKVVTVRVMRSETIRQGDNYVKDSIEFEVDTSPCPTIEEVDATVISMRQRILKLLSPVAPESRNTQKKQVTAQPQNPQEEVMAQPLPVLPTQRGNMTVEDIRMLFTSEIEDLLTFEDKETWIKVSQRSPLNNKCRKVREIIEQAGGSYVRATNTEKGHFCIPKAPQ